MILRWWHRAVDACFGGGGGGANNNDGGLIWHTDHQHPHFSIAVTQANFSLEDQSQVLTSPSATYVGVYDGHGGPEASRFISKYLIPYLHKLASEEGGVSVDVIKKAFSATEEEFLEYVKRSLGSSPNLCSVGSCCLVGVISSDGLLYVANLGDSRAVLGTKSSSSSSSSSNTSSTSRGRGRGVVAQRLSVDHNVSNEEVRKEVEALHPQDSHIVLHTRGVWRIKGIIQVSRSIGDVFLKRPESCRYPVLQQFGYPIPLTTPVITAEPSITVRKLRPQDLFLIFASDGLWEQLTDEAAIQIVSKYPRQGIARRLVRAALREAAKKKEMRYEDLKKIDKGAKRKYHDDISAIVIYLDRHNTNASSSSSSSTHNTDVAYTAAPLDIFSSSSSSNEDEAEHSMLGAVS